MKPANEDAEMAVARQAPGHAAAASETQGQIAQRWGVLREMLIQQLDMFENRGLTLRANDVDISQAAIGDLKRSILEFDALISGAG